MKLGIALPQLGNWATPENIITISQKAEELGYNSVLGAGKATLASRTTETISGNPGRTFARSLPICIRPDHFTYLCRSQHK